MGEWFKTENYGRWIGNAIVATAVALVATVLAVFFPVAATWATLLALLALFGVPLLARIAPPWLFRYIGRWAAEDSDPRARALELTAVVLVYVLFSLVVW